MTLEKRFWSKVKKGPGCWLWTACGRGNYGRFGIGSRTDGTRRIERAHRVAWFLSHGEWPTLDVLHTCDNRGCVRPSHLFQGTQADNNRDMCAKGRHVPGGAHPGSQHHNAKLTARQVTLIRKKYSGGKILKKYSWGQISCKALGEIYGVSQSQIRRIVRGERWKRDRLNNIEVQIIRSVDPLIKTRTIAQALGVYSSTVMRVRRNKRVDLIPSVNSK